MKGTSARVLESAETVTRIRAMAGAIALAGAAAAAPAGDVFVEAESFTDLGGWTVDQQAMDQMGSPYLLAHGLGRPVRDAATTVEFPAAGEYRIWVRTRDWTAPWKTSDTPPAMRAEGTPGEFRLLVNGTALPTTFGTDGAAWAWQDGGRVSIAQRHVALILRDLTGFAGRCDAILFSSDLTRRPPDGGPELKRLRQTLSKWPEEPADAGEYDLVVVGGGMAGCCAALSAARLGCRVALIQNRPVLDGNNSSEVRVGLVVRAEPNISLFLNTHANGVEIDGDRIAAAIAQDIRTGERRRFRGRVFADCAGDGNLGYLAGADFREGRESKAEAGKDLAPDAPDRLVMGTSVQWYAEEEATPSEFPARPWAVRFDEATCIPATRGDWDWETGAMRDQVAEAERIRDYAFRVIYGNWAVLRDEFARRRLAWVACIGGKRESRRLLGDVILCQQDIVGRRPFPDACVTTTWTIDLHYPRTPACACEAFQSEARHLKIEPYPIPFRCLYSRNVANLMMAGRNISVRHVALGTVRVMRTGGMMGEVVGMAASLCAKHGATPRGIYERHLDALQELMRRGAGRSEAP